MLRPYWMRKGARFRKRPPQTQDRTASEGGPYRRKRAPKDKLHAGSMFRASPGVRKMPYHCIGIALEMLT